MIKIYKHTIIKIAYILIDVVLMAGSISLACWMRHTAVPFDINFYDLFINHENSFRYVFLFWIVISVLFNNGYDLYQTKREVYESIEIWKVIKAIALSSFMTMVAIYLTKIEGFPRSILALTVLFITIFFSLWRVLKRLFVNYIVSHGYNNFNTLIVGAGKVGQALSQQIQERPELGIKLVGFLDDFKTNGVKDPGPKIVGKITDFSQIVRREFVNKVFITIHHDSQVFLKLLEQAKELGVSIRVVPQGFDLMGGEFCKYNIGFVPILEYYDAESATRQAGKRIFDSITALLLTILSLPVFIVVAIMIKLDSPGPVFYVSRRYSRKGIIFKMLKFRSMVSDADKSIEELKKKNEVDGPIFKIRNDPRVTRVGKMLRKYSLDELPQLINVLKGDMSLVGPRPLPLDQIEKEDLRQLKRLEVRPGITGLWQIRGRSDISFSRLVKWDVWYINNWSFWLDLNILLQTVPVVLKGKGAY